MSSQVSNAPHPMADESSQELQQTSVKRKRNLPGTPDPDAEVIALSPKTLMATNRFLCEVCGKGFQRDQNLQLHRRGHNLPWKLKQRDGQEIKRRVYVCPEVSCVHHDPSRALGDLTGIKKHFSRKHGEKKWKCEKCSKRYAVQSDWKAHQKVCGTREYRCDCGTLFARRDSFVTHRAFCDALAQENVKVSVDAQVETPKIRPVIEATVIESSLSPVCQQATSEKPISEIFESPGRDTWEASSAFNECRTSAGQLGGQVMPPNKVVVCPGLSLSLGTGLGPGPPIMSEFMSGTLSQMIATSTSHQISKLAQVNSDWDTRSNRPFIYGSPSIFTSMFTPSSSNSDSRNFGDSMAGLSIGINPSAENLIPQFGTQHNNAFFSASHQRQRGAQLPATTLLQKAAVMGVTKSSFLFRKPMDLSSSSTEEFHLRETWAGVTSSSASRHPTGASPSGDRLNSNYYDRYGVTGSSGFSPASYDGQDRTELLHDLSAGSSSSMASILHLGHNTEHERQGQCSLMNESHRQMSGSIARCSDLDETQREEASETNRMTLDFLGIGSQNSSFEKGVERANLVAAGVRPDQSSASKDTSHGNIEGCNR